MISTKMSYNTNKIFASKNYVNIPTSLQNNFHKKEDICMLCENIIRSLKKNGKNIRVTSVRTI